MRAEHESWFASAPGKVILMGEHAAVFGEPALVTALSLRTDACVCLGDAGRQSIVIELPDLDCEAELRWTDIDQLQAVAFVESERHREQGADFVPLSELDHDTRLPEVALFVGAALGEVSARWRADGMSAADLAQRRSRVKRVRVMSRAPMGAGCGSSAAVATTVVAAFDQALRSEGNAPTGGDYELRQHRNARIEAIALQVERYQHGRPSGVDTAAVLRGGTLRAQGLVSGQDAVLDASQGVSEATLLKLQSLDVPPVVFEDFRVAFTGTAAESTGMVVDAVRRARDLEPDRVDQHIRSLGRLSEELAQALSAVERNVIGPLISEGERHLEALGVVPKPVVALLRQIEDQGGFAKVSGAGSLQGAGAGVVLVYDPARTVDLGALVREQGHFEVLTAEIGATGLVLRQGS